MFMNNTVFCRIWCCLFFVHLSGCQSPPVRQTTRSESTKEAASAVEAVADALSQKKGQFKYCPLCGRRYSSAVVVCSKDNVELKVVEE